MFSFRNILIAGLLTVGAAVGIHRRAHAAQYEFFKLMMTEEEIICMGAGNDCVIGDPKNN